jgi:ElaB/YqjD/DUF883 family membrane-anchored ribosome-binding protein
VYHERETAEYPALYEEIEMSVNQENQREVKNMKQTMADFLKEEGRKQGEKLGELRSRRTILVRQLQRRFGKVPAAQVAIIERTQDLAQLDTWLDAVVTAATLNEVGIATGV